MKMQFFFVTLITILSLVVPRSSLSQGMMDNMMGVNNQIAQNDDGHTAGEEAKGEKVWNRLQNKEVECGNLTDEDFGALGEYFMGQMMGDSHEAMNNRLIQMMGEEGEEQMHISMGKRMSGCEPDAPLPQSMVSNGMMPMMMGMMGGDMNSIPMMGNWGQNPFAWFVFGSWLVTLTLVVWLVVGVLATIWLWKQLKKK